MIRKRIVCTVTNDLSFDQRMNRICTSLAQAGYHVMLVGRKRKKSLPLKSKIYRQKRLFCFFEKGKLFYAEYNIRLFFYLLFYRADFYNAIDLDSILPHLLVSKLKGKPLVYDAHEYFTEMEEIVARPMVMKAWQFIERVSVPRVSGGYTVSQGYADLFKKHYGVALKIVRNATVLKPLPEKQTSEQYILYQGAVNVGRALEQLIEAMQWVDCKLIVCGKGDVFEALQQQVAALGITSKVDFKGYVEPDQLRAYTLNATVGITLFTNAGLSNQYSLANRFFDYMHAGVPQLAMAYPEYNHFNAQYKVAHLIEDVAPKTIANALNKLLEDSAYYNNLVENCLEARQVYNWQKEEEVLLSVYKALA